MHGQGSGLRFLTGKRCYNQGCINKSVKTRQTELLKSGDAWPVLGTQKEKDSLRFVCKEKLSSFQTGEGEERSDVLEVRACHVSQWGDLKDG